MIGEFNVYGVFVPPLLVWVGAALPLTAVVRRVLRWSGFYRLVWHRPLFDLALLVMVVGAVVAVATRGAVL
ncbi:MAG TPA: DUF1656 domain-containing protein [Acetobacteraceae bacterium]|jgi:hypothetical protein|nr:DUF1656 domain-containing protein [Acetobacteraceae bacterium]